MKTPLQTRIRCSIIAARSLLDGILPLSEGRFQTSRKVEPDIAFDNVLEMQLLSFSSIESCRAAISGRLNIRIFFAVSAVLAYI
jgi:hypothetical protein